MLQLPVFLAKARYPIPILNSVLRVQDASPPASFPIYILLYPATKPAPALARNISWPSPDVALHPASQPIATFCSPSYDPDPSCDYKALYPIPIFQQVSASDALPAPGPAYKFC
mgnify:CR=1 FL=1